MADLVDLNLRRVDPELRAALKREAKAAGVDLREYSLAILKARAYLPPGVIPRPASPVSATPIRQDEPPNVAHWDKDDQPAIELAPGSESPAPAATRKACPHGWMNRALCEQCQATA